MSAAAVTDRGTAASHEKPPAPEASAGHGDTKHIVQSLLVNLTIAAVKTLTAIFTKSGSMLAEALHSFSDCGNQVLLLVGVHQAKKPATASHPFGYGRAVYFWSFMVALMLFLGGGAFSIYEGVHKIREPEPLERVWLGVLILLVSLGLEGAATFSNIKELNRRRGDKPFFQYLKDTTDSDLVVVFGENSAAVLGLGMAIVAIVLAWLTNDGRWDGVGSVLIGLVLVAVAVFLAVEVSSLLLGESAAPEISAAAREAAQRFPEIEQVLNIVTMQQGPGEVLVHVKLAFSPKLTIRDACRIINEFERTLRGKRSEVRWVFVEPDTPKPLSEAGGYTFGRAR
jgi:cation diffusion facilitator family transporter